MNRNPDTIADGDTAAKELDTADDTISPKVARAQRDLLAAENERLREAYDRLQRSRHRRVAAGLAAVGIVAGLSGLLYPAVADLAVVLAAIGGFGAVLTYYLTPERFVAGSVSREIAETHADHVAGLVAELGLSGQPVYDPRAETASCRLFVPQTDTETLPSPEALSDTFVVTADETARGVALQPTGAGLYREFAAAAGEPPAGPVARAAAVGESLVESFEIADRVDVAADGAGGRVTADVTGSLFGDDPSVDDPVVSTLAVAVATAAESPVTVDTARTDEGYTVSCHWPTEDETAEPGDGTNDDATDDGANDDATGDGANDDATDGGVNGDDDQSGDTTDDATDGQNDGTGA